MSLAFRALATETPGIAVQPRQRLQPRLARPGRTAQPTPESTNTVIRLSTAGALTGLIAASFPQVRSHEPQRRARTASVSRRQPASPFRLAGEQERSDLNVKTFLL